MDPRRAPVIAIAPDHIGRIRNHWGVPASYLAALGRAGAVPLLVDPTGGPEAIARSLDAADGVLLLGGLDVDPARYGEVPHPATGSPDPERDDLDLGVAAVALERGLPLLAVCRGFQVLAVVGGIALEQHLADDPTVIAHGPGRADVDDALHPVAVTPGSRLAEAAGGTTTLEAVASQHHQGIRRAPDGWVATGVAPDGVVEAIEPADPAAPWALAVQWHPERTADDAGGDALFRALVAAAEKSA